MERDDTELISSILSGDETAFNLLVRKYQKSVHALAWRITGDYHIAEEITQDTFLHAFKKLSTLNEPKQFSGWLHVSAKRQCLAWLRKKKMDMQSLESVPEIALEKAAYANYIADLREEEYNEYLREIVDDLLQELPNKERTVVILHYIEEMTCEAIAKQLSVSPNTVKSRLSRARNRLRVVDFHLKPIKHKRTHDSSLQDTNRMSQQKGIATMKDNLEHNPMQGFSPRNAKAQLGKGRIHRITYSPDGKSLAVASGIGIWIYDILTNRVIKMWVVNGHEVNCVEYSPDGHYIAGGCDDGSVWILNTKTGEPFPLTFDVHTDIVWKIAYSPDGKTIATDSRDETTRFWDVSSIYLKQSNTIINTKHTITKESFHANDVLFTSDGKEVVCVSWKDKISILNTKTYEPIMTSNLHPDCETTSTAFSPTQEIIAVGSDNGKIYLYDRITNELIITLTAHKEHVDVLTFSPDGKTLASASLYEKSIKLWDTHTANHIKTFKGHESYIRGLAFSPDGETLTSGSGDGTIRNWDIHSGDNIIKYTGYSEYVMNIAYNPNGNQIASKTSDHTIRLWDTRRCKNIETYYQFQETTFGITFNSDGNLLVASAADNGIKLLIVNTGEHKIIPTGQSEIYEDISFSPDGNTLVSKDTDNNIGLWDVQTCEEKKVQLGPDNCVRGIAFHPDGKTIATRNLENSIQLWDVDTGENLKTFFAHSGGVDCIEFSPDEKTLASAGNDDFIKLWDTNTNKSIMELTGHTDMTICLAFSPDGKTLASGREDGSIILRDTENERHKKILYGHSIKVNSMKFSPDGKTLASGSADGTVLLWEISS